MVLEQAFIEFYRISGLEDVVPDPWADKRSGYA
jgi:hypothetical protein